jgi:hypothetical protein
MGARGCILSGGAERSYHKLTYSHEVDKGGHCAAWEQPELFSAEMPAASRPML